MMPWYRVTHHGANAREIEGESELDACTRLGLDPHDCAVVEVPWPAPPAGEGGEKYLAAVIRMWDRCTLERDKANLLELARQILSWLSWIDPDGPILTILSHPRGWPESMLENQIE